MSQKRHSEKIGAESAAKNNKNSQNFFIRSKQ